MDVPRGTCANTVPSHSRLVQSSRPPDVTKRGVTQQRCDLLLPLLQPSVVVIGGQVTKHDAESIYEPRAMQLRSYHTILQQAPIQSLCGMHHTSGRHTVRDYIVNRSWTKINMRRADDDIAVFLLSRTFGEYCSSPYVASVRFSGFQAFVSLAQWYRIACLILLAAYNAAIGTWNEQFYQVAGKVTEYSNVFDMSCSSTRPLLCF